MAIDTQDKRRSAQSYAGALIAPVADGSLNEADRRHMAGTYRGLSGSGDTLTGTGDAYIDLGALTLWADEEGGWLHQAAWHIDDVQTAVPIDQTAFSVAVNTSALPGRGLLIFIASDTLADDTPLSVACGYEACTLRVNEDGERLYVFPNPPAGGATVNFSFAFDVRPAVFVLALSNIDAAGLTSADTAAADDVTLDFSATFAAHDLLISMTHSAGIHSYALSAAADSYQLAEEASGAINYQWTNITARAIDTAGADTVTVGAVHDYYGGGTPTYTTVTIQLAEYISPLVGTEDAFIGPLATLYAGVLEHEGQTLTGTAGATIASTATLYAGAMTAVMIGEEAATLSLTPTLYAGEVAYTSGPDVFITGFFIGMGMPTAISGQEEAMIADMATLYAGELSIEQFLIGEEAATIESTLTLYAGTAAEIYTATAYITAGEIHYS